jgi:hypothetical protein
VEDEMRVANQKGIPAYDETIVCQNPECKHLEAPPITGLFGVIGGGGPGIYSMCEHCGMVLSKTPATACETHNLGHTDLMVSPEAIDEATENVDVVEDTQPGTDLDK